MLSKEFLASLMIVLICYISDIGFILSDLWAGIRKAKARGEVIISYGLRKTVEKSSKYFNLHLVFTLIDIVQMLVCWHLNTYSSYNMPILPFFTVVVAIGIGVIEGKSIYEKGDAKDKAKMQEAFMLARELIRQKDNKSEMAATIFDKMIEEEGEKLNEDEKKGNSKGTK